MYDYGYTNGYGSSSSLSSTLNTMGIWGIIALVIAIIGGICLYFTVFSTKNEKTYNGLISLFYHSFSTSIYHNVFSLSHLLFIFFQLVIIS